MRITDAVFSGQTVHLKDCGVKHTEGSEIFEVVPSATVTFEIGGVVRTEAEAKAAADAWIAKHRPGEDYTFRSWVSNPDGKRPPPPLPSPHCHTADVAGRAMCSR